MSPDDSEEEASSGGSALSDVRDLVSAARGALEVALAPLLPLVESFRELMVAVEPRLHELALRMMRTRELFQHWERHASTTLKASISAQGLIVPVSQMSFSDLVGLLASHRDGGDAAVIQKIRDLYEEIFRAAGLFDNLEGTWAAHPLLKRRLALLHQALEAHKLGMFGVSIPTLIAQFEGLVADATSHVGQMGGSALRNHVATLAAAATLTGGMFTSFVNDALLAHFEHGSLAPPLSRHAILHGGDIDYATELNSRTAILLIDNMRELTTPQ